MTGTIIFYGALRSGTTLLRLMFDGHPDIACPGERDFMLDHLKPGPEGLQLDRAALARDRIFRGSGLTVPQSDKGAEAFAELLAEDRARSGKKVHMLVMHRGMAELRAVMPEARFVHLTRDPRDVARSSIGMGWAGNTWFGVDHWIETERQWQQTTPPAERVFNVRYETLLEEPEAHLTALCSFMGLTYSPEMLKINERSSYAPVDPKLAYQWRRKQTVQEVSELEHKLGALLGEAGYAQSAAGPVAPGFVRKTVLRLQNRAKIWQFRMRRFGVLDPLLVAVARRTGLRSLGYAAQARMDVVTNRMRK